jgi:hypothetical protein
MSGSLYSTCTLCLKTVSKRIGSILRAKIINPIYQSIEVFAQFDRLGEYWSGQSFQSPLVGAEVVVTRIFEG